MNNQRPPYPMQPQGTRPPPPHGHPQGPNAAAVRPPLTPNANQQRPQQQQQQQQPGNAPMPPAGQPRLAQGFNPNRPMQSPPLVNPSQPGQPPTIMRPAPSPVATNSPMTPQQQQQQPRPGYVGHSPSMAPGMGVVSPGSTSMASPAAAPAPAPSSTTEHHRRRRMYPEQITQAYMDEPATSMAPPQQQQQQPQYMTPAGGQATQGMAAPQQQPYPGYNNQQASVSSMATQFGSMSLGGSNVSVYILVQSASINKYG